MMMMMMMMKVLTIFIAIGDKPRTAGDVDSGRRPPAA